MDNVPSLKGSTWGPQGPGKLAELDLGARGHVVSCWEPTQLRPRETPRALRARPRLMTLSACRLGVQQQRSRLCAQLTQQQLRERQH